MPNLAIYFSKQSEKESKLQEKEHRMERILTVPMVKYEVSRFIGDNLAAVNILLPIFNNRPQPVFNSAKDLWLMLDGEIYGKEGLEKYLEGQDTTTLLANDAALCLALYQKLGEKFVEILNGQFNIAIYSIREKTLKIFNDRLGQRPLFFYNSVDSFACSSEMKALLAAWNREPVIDEIGLLEFFAYAHNIGDKTWISNIKVVPPASIITVKKDSFEHRYYWKVNFKEHSSERKEMEYVDELTYLLKLAGKRFIQGDIKLGVFLSGGLDSRIVAASIGTKSLPIIAHTFGPPESRDVLYAKEICRILGYKHINLDYPPGYLSASVKSVVWRNECAFPFYDSTSVFFHSKIKQDVDVILTGHGGNTLTGAHLKNTLPCINRKGIIETFWQRITLARKETLKTIFAKPFFDKHWPALHDAFVLSFNDINQEKPLDLINVWDIENCLRRLTFHSPRVDRYLIEVRSPILDNEILNFFLTLPLKFRMGQRVYKKTIVYGFPTLSDIPWAYNGRAIQTNPYIDSILKYYGYAERLTSSLFKKLHLRNDGLDSNYRSVDLDMRSDENLWSQVILPFIKSDDFPHDIFNSEGIKELMLRYRQGKKDFSHIFGCFTTFVIARDFFINSAIKEIPCKAVPNL